MLHLCRMKESKADENPELHLQILKEVTAALSESSDLDATLTAILRLLKKHAGMKRGALSLINPATGDFGTEISEGFDGKNHPGEKIIAMVLKSGRPVAIPSVGDEPLYLDKHLPKGALKKEKIAFLCVAVRYKGKVVGALSVDMASKSGSFGHELRLLEIISTVVAAALHAHRRKEEEKERLVNENRQMKAEMRERFHVHNIVGNDKRILDVYEQIHQVAESDATVLLCGETGTGKELVANAIHYHSARAQGPMVKINCAALPENLIESELFGHEKGSFTGAFETKPGRFELADGGTLFMDEVGELSQLAQSKLLRAIQEREIERVGGKKPIRVNVRIIAATNRDLGEMVTRGRFRHDLFYRLNVFPIYLPSLRERRSDIPLLTDFFLEKFAKRDHKPIKRVATSAIDMLMSYHWPGNVRELENCIERAVLLAKAGAVQAHHLPPTLQTAEASSTGFKGTLKDAVTAYEKDLVSDALKSARGNLTKTARLLGSTPRIVAYKVKQFELDPEAYTTKMSK